MPDLQARAPGAPAANQQNGSPRGLHAAGSSSNAPPSTGAGAGPSTGGHASTFERGTKLLSSLRNLLPGGPSFTQRNHSSSLPSGPSQGRMRGAPNIPGSIASFTIDPHSSSMRQQHVPGGGAAAPGTSRLGSWVGMASKPSRKELSAMVRSGVPPDAMSGGSVIKMNQHGGDMLRLDPAAPPPEQYETAPAMDWKTFVNCKPCMQRPMRALRAWDERVCAVRGKSAWVGARCMGCTNGLRGLRKCAPSSWGSGHA